MRKTRTVLWSAALIAVMIGGSLFLRKTVAQGQVAPGQGGGSRLLRQLPFASGNITRIDPSTNTIVIQPQFGNTSQTIQLSSKTEIVAQTIATVADLHVNDRVQIQGVPTGITASSVLDGKMPDFIGGTGPLLPGSAPGTPNTPAPVENIGSASASATGTVTATNPLTISLSPGVSLTIKLTPDARVMKIAPTTLTDLKEGDKVMAVGQTNNDGVFITTGVAVNLSMGMGPQLGRFSAYPGSPPPAPPVSLLPNPGALNR